MSKGFDDGNSPIMVYIIKIKYNYKLTYLSQELWKFINLILSIFDNFDTTEQRMTKYNVICIYNI